MQEAQVQSLGQEDPLEKEMVTHSSLLACPALAGEFFTTEPPGKPTGIIFFNNFSERNLITFIL